MEELYIIQEDENNLEELINEISREYKVNNVNYVDAFDHLIEFGKDEGVIPVLEYRARSGPSVEFAEVANMLLNYEMRPILLITDVEGMDADDLNEAASVLLDAWAGNANDAYSYLVAYYDEVKNVSFRVPGGPVGEGAAFVIEAIQDEGERPYLGD